MTHAFPQGPVIILGASYAKGWRPEPIDGVVFVNRGAEGQQSWELLARFDADVLTAKPRAVVIWGFINDIFRSPKSQIDQTVALARQSLAEMTTRARQAGIEPVLATEVTVRGKGSAFSRLVGSILRLVGRRSYQDYVNRHVVATNDWIRDFARQHNALLLDFHRALSDRRGRRRGKYATADGSHISAEGYAALDGYARPLLQKRLSAG